MTQALRYTAIVKHLVLCPPEIVHEIIGDLSIAKILDILSVHNNTYLYQCVSSHIVLGTIFPPQVLAEATTYFVVYTRLATMTQDRRRVISEPDMRLLSFDGIQFRSQTRDVLKILRDAVLKRMEAYYPFLPVLKRYSARPIPDGASWKTLDSAAKIAEVFRTLDETENIINSKKAEQLGRMAALLERYPGMLRTRNDLSQEARRNPQHLVRNLMVWKRNLFLVPYNRVLRAFLKVLKIHPPSKAPSHLKDRLQRDGHIPHDYPPEIEIVLQGMEFIFPRDVEIEQVQTLVRTDWTIFSTSHRRRAYGYYQPEFYSSLVGDRKGRDLVPSFIPASDMELDWLESFLHICEYMGSMQLEFKSGQSVAAFWAIYA